MGWIYWLCPNYSRKVDTRARRCLGLQPPQSLLGRLLTLLRLRRPQSGEQRLPVYKAGWNAAIQAVLLLLDVSASSPPGTASDTEEARSTVPASPTTPTTPLSPPSDQEDDGSAEMYSMYVTAAEAEELITQRVSKRLCKMDAQDV